MPTTRPILALIAALLLPALSNSASAAEPEFTIIGQLGGRVTFGRNPRGLVTGVSGDGKTIIGSTYYLGDFEAFSWTEDTGFVGLGDLPSGNDWSLARGVSADGSVIVGYSSTAYQFSSQSFNQAFVWNLTEGMVGIGPLGFVNIAGETFVDVSADGMIATGRTQTHGAIIWDTINGTKAIGRLPGATFSSSASAISGDGTRVVGISGSDKGTEAFLWDETNGMIGLGDLPGGLFQSTAVDISADGSTIVGSSRSDLSSEAFVWTEETGMVGLGNLQLSDSDDGSSDAHAVSGDGSIVIGTVRGQGIDQPFIWVKNRGMLSMFDLLDDAGIDYSGLREFSAADISDDGRVVVGTAYSVADSYNVGWRLEIDLVPEPSTALLTLLACISVSTNRKAAQVCSFGN